VRLALTVERNAQDQPIEDAVAAALLAWEASAAAAAKVENAEREVAAGLGVAESGEGAHSGHGRVVPQPLVVEDELPDRVREMGCE
jgi:hypothetical protein